MSEPSPSPHLAELRRQAREAGIDRSRMLRRDELIEQLRAHGVDVAEAGAESGGREQRPKSGGEPGGREQRPKSGGGRPRREQTEDVPTRAAEGVLDVTPRGHGFLRGPGLQAGDDDVYVSASQIKRCALRAGDVVNGPARDAKRGERYTALVHVDKVNGAEPQDDRSAFEDLKPVRPERQLPLELDSLDDVQRKLVDAHPELAGVRAGDRVLVRAQSGAARFDLLRAISGALAAKLGKDVIVLLIDVPPEEMAGWQDGTSEATVAALPADASPAAAGRVARLALECAKRKAESGADAVLIVDSLTRLAVFEEDIAGVKRLFGAGRLLGEEGAGSLTVIATTLGEDEADRAVATTETALVSL